MTLPKIDTCLYNGKLMPCSAVAFSANNRAFRYGDGIFETMRVFEGEIHFLSEHFERLNAGIKRLQLLLPKDFSEDFFCSETQRLIKYVQNHAPEHALNYRLRLTIFRTEGGFYTPENNAADYLIELSPLSAAVFSLNEKGLKIGTFEDCRLSCDALANLKTANSRPYVWAALHRKNQGWDDCLLFNQHGRIAESSNSTVFLIKNDTLHTPPLAEGVTDGTMRKIIVRNAAKFGFKIKEKPLKLKHFSKAEAVFLSNAITGVQWVETLEYRTAEHSETLHFAAEKVAIMLNFLNQKIKKNS